MISVHVSYINQSLYVRHNNVLRRQLGIRFQELFFGLLAVDQRTDLVVSILSERAIIQRTGRSFNGKIIGRPYENGISVNYVPTSVFS